MARGRRRFGETTDTGVHRALDGELREIVIEERCSFGPELRSELASEYQRLRGGRRWNRSLFHRIGSAAVVLVVLAAVSLTVPRVRSNLPEGLGLAATPELAEPLAPVTVGGEEMPHASLGQAYPVESVGGIDSGAGNVHRSALVATLPKLRDTNAARRILSGEIPAWLREEESRGTVHLLIWVSPDGAVELPQIDRSSGFAELDFAALRAIRSFSFDPATRLGVPVGTWVRFPIGFDSESTRVLLSEEVERVAIPWSN